MTTATSRTDLDAVSCPEDENPYETRKLLSEYLLFHYGSSQEVLPFTQGPHEGLGYPVRCVRECLEPARLPSEGRA
ncbi:MAG: hypothetical protein WCL08_04740, partial [Verrucomicrobiota bacterium]